jgi:hypothetical protein
MEDFTHTELLKLQSLELTGRTVFCPEDQQIAEYFDGFPGPAEHEAVTRHLADCRFCLARIGVLGRLQDVRDFDRVPEEALATAKQMALNSPSRQTIATPAWAAAAALVLVLLAIANREPAGGLEPGPGPTAPASIQEEPHQLRSVNRDAKVLEVLAPAPGEALAPGALIRWTAIPGNTHYSVFILSGSGDVLWTERMEANEWLMQDGLQLSAADQYYLRVEASLPDGRTVSSKHRAFRGAAR